MIWQDRRIYTLGHGERELKPFLALLMQAGIQTVLDIRARPESVATPHFSMDALRESLDAIGMSYHWAGRQLGEGRTPRPDSVHVALVQAELRGFADHMEGQAFATAMGQLVNLATRAPSVLLAGPREPEACHRRLIADRLVLEGWTVVHLLDSATGREHVLSPEARRESIELIYDRI